MVYTYMVKKLLGCFMMFYDCVLPTLDQNSDNDDNDQSDNWIMVMITMIEMKDLKAIYIYTYIYIPHVISSHES